MTQIPDHPNRNPQSETSVFTKTRRVQLYYKLLDYLPVPERDGFGEAGGSGLYKLDELLRRHLGKLALAPGDDIEQRILSFIRTAPEEDLLTLIELTPAAYCIAENEERSSIPYAGFVRRDLETAVKGIVDDLNRFLEFVGSSARFMPDGSFTRDGLVMNAAVPVAKLPDREALINDITRLLGHEPIGVVFIDLDNFKTVNDSQGHTAGNKCLERVIEIIGAVLVHKGQLYRYGGDEFVAVIRNATLPETTVTAERVRNEIEKGNPGGEIPVTASIGVSSSECPGLRHAQDLVDACDKAMYKSKQSGRNRVTVWSLI